MGVKNGPVGWNGLSLSSLSLSVSYHMQEEFRKAKNIALYILYVVLCKQSMGTIKSNILLVSDVSCNAMNSMDHKYSSQRNPTYARHFTFLNFKVSHRRNRFSWKKFAEMQFNNEIKIFNEIFVGNFILQK